MSNQETHNLPVLEVEPHQVREALRCVLHTIVFNRALGMVKPQEVESELFDVAYVKCGDAEAERAIEAKLAELCAAIEKRPAELTQVTLSFYERRRKQAWFGAADERTTWEQWCVNLVVLAPFEQQQALAQGAPGLGATAAAQQRLAKLQRSMEELLAYVVLAVNEKKDHIPPVVSQATLTYPFDVAVRLTGGPGGGGPRSAPMAGLAAVKKLLLNATPPPALG